MNTEKAKSMEVAPCKPSTLQKPTWIQRGRSFLQAFKKRRLWITAFKPHLWVVGIEIALLIAILGLGLDFTFLIASPDTAQAYAL